MTTMDTIYPTAVYTYPGALGDYAGNVPGDPYYNPHGEWPDQNYPPGVDALADYVDATFVRVSDNWAADWFFRFDWAPIEGCKRMDVLLRTQVHKLAANYRTFPLFVWVYDFAPNWSSNMYGFLKGGFADNAVSRPRAADWMRMKMDQRGIDREPPGTSSDYIYEDSLGAWDKPTWPQLVESLRGVDDSFVVHVRHDGPQHSELDILEAHIEVYHGDDATVSGGGGWHTGEEFG